MKAIEHVEATIDSRHVRVSPSITTKSLADGSISHRVRWSVARRQHERSERTEKGARAIWARLITAEARGELWQRGGQGLPVSMVPPKTSVTLLDLALGVFAEDYAGWSSGQRGTMTEAMSRILAVAVVPGRRPPPTHALRLLLRNQVLPPESNRKPVRPRDADPRDVRHAQTALAAGLSLPVTDLTPARAKEILAAAALRPNGQRYAKDGRMHQRGAMRIIVARALELRVLTVSPLQGMRQKRTDDDIPVTRENVPTPAQAREIVAAVCRTNGGTPSSVRSARYRAMLTLAWLVGLRPSELVGLRVGDVTLPETGWGEVRVARPTIVTEARLTDGKSTVEDRKATKARRSGEERVVPLPAEGVRALREHMDDNNLWSADPGTRVFFDGRGGPLSPSQIGSIWRAALRRMEGTPWLGLRVYDLRHTSATWQLEAGQSPTAVAKRLGHSPAMLMRVYARWFDDGKALDTSAMDAALA